MRHLHQFIYGARTKEELLRRRRGSEALGIGQFILRAFDPKTGQKKWEYPTVTPTAEAWSGTVSTAGGVVFFGDDQGQLVGVNSRTGEHLWHFGMGEGLTASPITYAVDGKQYVAIASSSAIFSFGLFEPVKPVPIPKIKIE